MTEAEQERARIVAWLRGCTYAGWAFEGAASPDQRSLTLVALESVMTLALAIERGEHLEGENG